ncbi:MAG: GTP-binding protein [Candidatus Kariarchaeaceae archaeon]|jgi:small GTP-binding protein
MAINKNILLSELFNNFLKINTQVEAIIVSDQDGLVIAGERRKDVDLELVSIMTAIVNPVIERFRDEFSYKKFGTANFDTERNRILFISITENITLSLVIENLGSIDKIAPYAYFLAEKVAQILVASEGDLIELSIPNFEYKTEGYYDNDNQYYQIGLETGGMYRFKFIVIGEHEVGKTSILRRFVEGRFLADYRTTIGLNVLTHNFEFFGNEISLFLWDIGAQQYFKRYRKVYYKGAQAAFIVFDITNRDSFYNVVNWFDELNEFSENKLSVVIVGNKQDLEQQREIDKEEAATLAEMLSEKHNRKISYIETSALTGENIEEAFGIVAYHYIMLSKMFEESKLKTKIINEINSILGNRNSLSIAFISMDFLNNPGLKLLQEIDELGAFSKKGKKDRELYRFSNGLILESFNFDSMKISDSDGVCLIFDAKKRDSIDPHWNSIVLEIIDALKDNAVVLIGIITKELVNWSKMMGEFDFYTKLEEKQISYFLFNLRSEFRLELYEQLNTLFNTINNI